MPKEYVYGEDHGQPYVLDYGDGRVDGGITESFAVKVGWNREAGHMQIATVDPAAEARIYPSVMVNAELYQQYIGVVRAVAGELTDVRTEDDLEMMGRIDALLCLGDSIYQ